MGFDLYEIGKAKLYRDKFDRVWLGPLKPAVGDGPMYYMDINSRFKTHEAPTFVDEVKKPEPVQTETAAVCAVCNTPLTEKQVKRGGKYCSATCRNKAAKARAGK